MLEIITNIFDIKKIEEPYNSYPQYISDLIKWMDIKIYYYLDHHLEKGNHTSNELDKYRGLVITNEEMISVINKIANNSPDNISRRQQEAKEYLAELELIKYYIESRKQLTLDQGIFLPLDYLSQQFSLNDFEQHCLLLSTLIHFDKNYQKVFGYLNDDVTLKYPTVDTAIKLFAPHLTNEETIQYLLLLEEKLLKYFILPQKQYLDSILFTNLQLKEKFLKFIFDNGDWEDKLEGCRIFYPSEEIPDLTINQEIKEKIVNYLVSNQTKTVFYFWGPEGSGRKLQIKHTAKELKRCVIFADINALLTSDHKLDEAKTNDLGASIILYDAIFCLTNFEDLLKRSENPQQVIDKLLKRLEDNLDCLFIISQSLD